MHGDAAASELVSVREEAFACVAFADKLLVFGAELVPEGVEGFIVRSVDYVAEPMEGCQ